jgi:hypothetical protein
MKTDMNNFFTQLKEKAREIKLSHDEKQAMRVRLYNYLELHPVGNFAAPSPKIFQPVPSAYYFFSPRYMVPIALVLVIGLSGGTAFAAQSALPGNPLYAIKININEKVQTALATTPQAKAEVNAQIATTRLEEAETLASTGKLDATTTAELASNFAQHAEAAQANTIAVASNDPGVAAQLGADFASRIVAHGAILAQLGADSSSTETMQNSNALAMQAEQEAGHGGREDDNAVAIAAVAPQANVEGFATGTGTSSAAISAPYPRDAEKNPQVDALLGPEASTSIAAALQDFAALAPTLDATTSAQINAQLAALQSTYAAGDFVAALRMAIQLDAYLKAGKRFDGHLLNSLLEHPGGSDQGPPMLQISAPDIHAR